MRKSSKHWGDDVTVFDALSQRWLKSISGTHDGHVNLKFSDDPVVWRRDRAEYAICGIEGNERFTLKQTNTQKS